MATKSSVKPHGCTDCGGGTTSDAVMVHLYQCERWSTYRIAAEYGIDRQRIGRILRRAGVTLRTRGRGGSRPGRRQQEPDNLPDLLTSWYAGERLNSTQIGDKLGIPARTVRARLAEYGIARRSRGPLNREDRHVLDRELLEQHYTQAQLTAAEVGVATGTSRSIVLRNAHDLGIAVRVGGPPPGRGPTEITLIDALYADLHVAATVARHGLPVVPAGGSLAQRFPQRVPLSVDLLQELYVGAGVAVTHIELLTGQPVIGVTRALHAAGVPLRPPGGRCPFLRRWRSAIASPRQRSDNLNLTTRRDTAWNCRSHRYGRWRSSTPGHDPH
jgi:hypothetical protein